MLAPNDHIFLFLGLFFLFISVTWINQKKIDSKFWAVLLFPIIAYVFLIGLRYGWGVDYVRYEASYEKMEFDLEYDPGFSVVQIFLYEIGLKKFWMASMVFAFLFIHSSFLVIKNIGSSSKYMIMLFLPATIDQNTFAIRQYVAISFAMYAFYFISSNQITKKYVKYAIASLLVVFSAYIHAGSLSFTIPLIVMYLLRVNKPLRTSIAVALYISVIVFSSVFIEYIRIFLDQYASYIIVTEHLQGYVDYYDRILDNEQVEMFGHSGLFLALEYVGRIILIILSGWALKLKPNKMVGLFFNLMIIGLCFQQLFFTSEIFRRLVNPLYIMYYIPAGYALYILFSNQTRKVAYQGRFLFQSMSYILLLYIYYPIYKFIFYFSLAGFIWDKV